MGVMTRSGALRPVATLCLVACLLLVLYGLVVRGFAIEATTAADQSAQEGQELAFPAVIGAIAAGAALLAGRRPAAWLGVAVALVAIAVSVILGLIG
jgi:hypothetical protein